MPPDSDIVPLRPGLPLDDDAQCVQRIRRGDEQAFEALFHEYYEVLCDFVDRYVGSPDVAEEIVQQMFVRIWENRSTWFVRSALKPYLYQAARNRALNHLKHEKVRRSFAERVLRLNVSAGTGQARPGPEQQQEASDFAAAVASAMAKLPPHYREVVQLRTRDHMTHPEIARILDLPVKTVETRARRGLQALRRLLPPIVP